MSIAPRPKVALVSIGLGRIQRGFERMFYDLFDVVRHDVDATLYRSAGECGPGERIPPWLARMTGWARLLPLGRVGMEYREYRNDCLAFGLSLIPELRSQRYDVVHYVDPPLGPVLHALQRAFRYPGALLFTNGCCMPPQYYPRGAHVHHCAQPLYAAALAAGVPASGVTFVPVGIHAARFSSAEPKEMLRRKHGIGPATFVILAVTALKRSHKRVDHVIEEVARLDGDVLLWIDGNPEEPDLFELARARLGQRCRITHVPSSEVKELYRLADVLVHAALEEAFGLAVVEARSTGLMALVHDSEHFRWLVPEPACRVDMSAPGRLADRLHELGRDRDKLADGRDARAADARSRFDWSSLRFTYVAMYESLISGAAREARPGG